MPWRKVLLAVLCAAFLVELLFPVGGFFAPEAALRLFAVGSSPDTQFLTFVLSWCLLFVAVVCGLAAWLVARSEPRGWTLSYALGLWWMGIGGSLFLVYHRLDNLFLDFAKGALIVVTAYLSRSSARR